MIVIFSNPGDLHARAVRAALAPEAASRVVNLAAFPKSTTVSITFNGESLLALSDDGGRFDFGDCRAIWWRRPGRFSFDGNMRLGDRDFAYRECDDALNGLLQSLSIQWLNRPWDHLRAARKVYQLHVARTLGWDVPRTLISNDPREVRRFLKSLHPGRAICKSLTADEHHWRETRIVGQAELNALEAVRHSPVVFQEYIEPGRDLRVTVVGDDLFVAGADPRLGDYEYDWRFGSPSPLFTKTIFSDDLSAKAMHLVRSLGLAYAAIDIRVGANGRHVFLEVNPGGQWLFVEQSSGLPITRAVADWLARADRG